MGEPCARTPFLENGNGGISCAPCEWECGNKHRRGPLCPLHRTHQLPGLTRLLKRCLQGGPEDLPRDHRSSKDCTTVLRSQFRLGQPDLMPRLDQGGYSLTERLGLLTSPTNQNIHHTKHLSAGAVGDKSGSKPSKYTSMRELEQASLATIAEAL